MTHHQEIFTELDLTEPAELYQNRHKMQRWRDEGDDSPWDGDKYLFDERCPKCRTERLLSSTK